MAYVKENGGKVLCFNCDHTQPFFGSAESGHFGGINFWVENKGDHVICNNCGRNDSLKIHGHDFVGFARGINAIKSNILSLENDLAKLRSRDNEQAYKASIERISNMLKTSKFDMLMLIEPILIVLETFLNKESNVELEAIRDHACTLVSQYYFSIFEKDPWINLNSNENKHLDVYKKLLKSSDVIKQYKTQEVLQLIKDMKDELLKLKVKYS